MTNHAETFDIQVNVHGGGELVRLAPRATVITSCPGIDDDAVLKPALSQAGFGRVTREVERKKVVPYGARRRKQFSKRQPATSAHEKPSKFVWPAAFFSPQPARNHALSPVRRRSTISAPRMAVRSAMPWLFRWVVSGHRAWVLWCRSPCGPLSSARTSRAWDTGSKEELAKLVVEGLQLRESDKAQSVANTRAACFTAERARRTSWWRRSAC